MTIIVEMLIVFPFSILLFYPLDIICLLLIMVIFFMLIDSKTIVHLPIAI